nr:hypothetical protein [Mycoplasmopsis bovis]
MIFGTYPLVFAFVALLKNDSEETNQNNYYKSLLKNKIHVEFN